MKTMLKVASAAGLLGLAAASSSALAAPLPYLTYQQYAGWDETTSAFDGGTSGMEGLAFANATGAPYPDNTYTRMSWTGINSTGPSFIDIYSHNSTNAPGTPTPGEWHAGDWAVITTLTQTNNALSINPGTGADIPNPLWSVDAVANLHIGDNNGSNIFSDLNNVTSIEFWETYNDGVGCDSPNPLGTACDDIFRVTALDFAPVQFELDGYEYTVSFTILPGESTNNGAPAGQTLICSALSPCDGIDVPDEEIWVFTPEYNPGTSTVYVAMSYTVRAVPEPSVVALFALGMLGLGFAARRRKEDTVA